MWFSFFITWEQRKLGDLGKAQSGIGFPDKEQGGKIGIPFFKVSDMNNVGNELEMNRSNNYVSPDQIKKNGWSPIEETSVIFAKVGAAIMLNRKRLVRFPFLLDNNTMAYKFSDSWDIEFGRTLFERIDLTSLVQVGALPSYNAGDVENMEAAIPQMAEQYKLGALFKSLDNLITLHQCKGKCRFYQVLWKILSSKMTIYWEQRKFGDVFDYERPDRYIVVNDKYNDNFKTPVLTANKGFILGYTNEDRTYDKPCIIFDDFTLDCKFVDFKFMVKSSALKILTVKIGNILRFAYERLNSSKIENLGHARHYISVVQPTETTMPTCDEQECIAILFEQLDNLITLHQRKQNIMLTFKKCHFYVSVWQHKTTTWEQRKLGEYFTERNERSGEGELISVTINAGIKKFNELGRFDTKPEDLSKYKRVEVGDIAYNSMRMWQGASGYSPYSGILSPAYTVISPKIGVSSLFFAYLIKRPQMIHLFEINSQGLTSDTWNLKFPAFSKIEASAPIDIDEQENISELFTVLDNLITLHQRGKKYIGEIKNDKRNKTE